MKIAAWNCNMAFRKKAASIAPYCPDLLVVPECECPERFASAALPCQLRLVTWIGDNPHKGLGVFAAADLELHLHAAYDPSIKYVAPLIVSGRHSFNLLAIWAMDDREHPRNSYIARVWRAINSYVTLLEQPAFIVGDFNWNKIWDRDTLYLHGNLTSIIDFLQPRGIGSLYHSFFAESFGCETRPTLYLHRKQNKPYHIDYIFASETFLPHLRNVEVGDYQKWIALSDHMPIMATFEET